MLTLGSTLSATPASIQRITLFVFQHVCWVLYTHTSAPHWSLTECFSRVEEVSVEFRVGEEKFEELIYVKVVDLVKVDVLLLVLVAATRYNAYYSEEKSVKFVVYRFDKEYLHNQELNRMSFEKTLWVR